MPSTTPLFVMLKRLGPTLVLVPLMAFAVFVLATERIRRPLPAPVPSQPAALPDSPDAQRRSAAIETEVVAVTRRGFEPSAITRSEGKFILAIENPIWQNLDLRLSRENGDSLKEIRASREEPEWNDIQDLRPGRYLLTEQNHTDWKVLITITAR